MNHRFILSAGMTNFFVLKVEKEAYYIIDTLGERLFEGCNHAYVLKFYKETTVYQLPEEQKLEDEKCGSTHQSAPTENLKSIPVDISKPSPVANGNRPQKETPKDKETDSSEIVEKRDCKERLVLLGGGPSCAFSKSDSEIIEKDFMALKNLFKAEGDGLPGELVEKAAMRVIDIFPLFSTNTED